MVLTSKHFLYVCLHTPAFILNVYMYTFVYVEIYRVCMHIHKHTKI